MKSYRKLGWVMLLLAGRVIAQISQWDEVAAGTLLMTGRGGSTRVAPSLATDVSIEITGNIARVSVRQQFENTGTEWAEAKYLFPLPEDAAVDQLRMQVGERVIKGEIKEKKMAREIYTGAKQAGQRASLVEQQRPNLFTTELANIAPAERIEIHIEYQQTVQRNGLEYSLRFPMTLTPRYLPRALVATAFGASDAGEAVPFDGTPPLDVMAILAGVSPLLAAKDNNVNPIGISVDLLPGFALGEIHSVAHPVQPQLLNDSHARIELNAGSHQANADFVLRWRPRAMARPEAAYYRQQWHGDEYGLLMLTPPTADRSAASMPRDVVYVLDTSGSMGGESIRQARQALQLGLAGLAPQDRFNVIEFNSYSRSLWPDLRLATVDHISEASQFVAGLEAEGGTEMALALTAALCGACAEPGRVRQVIFLTDGAVANEQELFGLIQRRLGNSRLFTVGIGSAPNSYFMRKAAVFGKGTFTFIAQASEVSRAMGELFSKIQAPVMSDIQVLFDGKPSADTYPSPIPDLYAGEPLVVAVKHGSAPSKVEVRGLLDGKLVASQVLVRAGQRKGIHVLWAGQALSGLNDEYGTSHDTARRAQLQAQMTAIALQHHVVSTFTSLVAVESKPVRSTGLPVASAVLANNPPAGSQFAAAGTATPANLLGLSGLLCLLFACALFVVACRQEQGSEVKA